MWERYPLTRPISESALARNDITVCIRNVLKLSFKRRKFGVNPNNACNFKIPLSSVVERLAVNQEALIRYSDDRNVEGEPISRMLVVRRITTRENTSPISNAPVAQLEERSPD